MHVFAPQQGDERLLENFLAEHAESSMFLRSNLRNSGLSFADRAFHGDYLATRSRAEAVTGVLAHYWNGNVMVQAPDPASCHLLADAFRRRVVRPIAGLQGPTEQVDALLPALDLCNASFALFADDGLFVVERAGLIKPALLKDQSVEMAAAAEADRETLRRWVIDYEREALGRDLNDKLEAEVDQRVQRFNERADWWVLRIGGRPVAMSAFSARLPDTVQVGLVWTPPENRGKTYARAIVALTLERAFAGGVERAILFTDNPAAKRAYAAIGFRRCGSYRLAILREPVNLPRPD